MRNFLAGLLVCSFLAGSTAMAQTKVATVDLRKVFDNYWKRKQADAAIKEEAAEMEKENAGMMTDLNKAKDEYKTMLESANDQAVSAEEREKRKKACDQKLKQLRDREETIVQYQKTARTKIEERLGRTRENILKEIRTVIDAKAEAAGYSIVLDTAAQSVNNTPIVVFAKGKETDLTDPVLDQLNAAAPAESTKPAATTK
jgi:outer membrane protein